MSKNRYAGIFCFLAFIFSVLLPSLPARAQNAKTINGTIIDAGTKSPVEFATVAIQDLAGKVIDGATCDMQGKFAIPKIAPGSYKLAVSFIGYQTKVQDLTVPAAGGNALNLGKVELPLDSKSLKEVNITAEKSTIEETDDGFVYNAEKDLNAAGGTASDLLKNIPGISIDPDGNLEMQGTTKIKVLIDNKPSSIMAGNIAEALRQIPANMISKVEVITTPSAKYDAEGTGGVINIITKKNTSLQGYNGGLNATTGNRAHALNGNMSTRLGKVGLNGNLGANLNRGFGNGAGEQQYFKGSERTTSSEYENDGQGFNGQISSNIDFNDKNSLGATFRFGKNNWDRDGLSTALDVSTLPASLGRINLNDRSVTDNKGTSSSIDANVDFTHKFKKKDQELNLLMLYSQNGNDGGSYTVRDSKTINSSNKEIFTYNLQDNKNNSANEELAFQADYEHPFNKLGNLEAGSKIIFRNNLSTSEYKRASALDAPLILNQANDFSYDQNIFSSYVNYGFRLKKKYNFRIGGRYEYTNIIANFASQRLIKSSILDTASSITKPYSNFMPNITVSTRLNKENARLSLNYSTRIFRPQIDYLNPYIDSTSRSNIRMGNPNLLPELTHNLQATYSNYLKKSYTGLNVSLYWRQTDDDIGQFRTFARIVNPDALKDTNPHNDTINSTTSTWLNNGNNITYGTNISVNTRLKKMFPIGTNISLYYNEINGFIWSDLQKKSLPISNSSLMYNINFNAGFRVPGNAEGQLRPFRDIGAQLSANISSPRVSLQGKNSSFQRYSASIRKEFVVKKSQVKGNNGDRASLNFSIENFLNSGNQVKSTTYNEQFTQVRIENYYNRVFRVGLSYSFSRMEYKAKPERERKSIVNDDTRKGDIGEVKEIREPKVNEQNNKNGNQKGNNIQKKPATATPVPAPKK